jgi:hypothetical protein
VKDTKCDENSIRFRSLLKNLISDSTRKSKSRPHDTDRGPQSKISINQSILLSTNRRNQKFDHLKRIKIQCKNFQNTLSFNKTDRGNSKPLYSTTAETTNPEQQKFIETKEHYQKILLDFPEAIDPNPAKEFLPKTQKPKLDNLDDSICLSKNLGTTNRLLNTNPEPDKLYISEISYGTPTTEQQLKRKKVSRIDFDHFSCTVTRSTLSHSHKTPKDQILNSLLRKPTEAYQKCQHHNLNRPSAQGLTRAMLNKKALNNV